MSTKLNTGFTCSVKPLDTGYRFALVQAEWNSVITDSLCQGALETLHAAGIDTKHNVTTYKVPGTIELVNVAAMLLNREDAPDGIIVIGCVIRGDTPHFDYVCSHTTEGVAMLNARGKTPVTFCVLTVETQQQAADRAGGALGNKGAEAAVTAIQMANIHHQANTAP